MRSAVVFALLFSGFSVAASAQSRLTADPNWLNPGTPGPGGAAATVWAPALLADPADRPGHAPARLLFGSGIAPRNDFEASTRFEALEALNPSLQTLYGPDGAAPRVVFFDLRGPRAVAHVESTTPAGPATYYFELRNVNGMWQVVGHRAEVLPRR